MRFLIHGTNLMNQRFVNSNTCCLHTKVSKDDSPADPLHRYQESKVSTHT
jgi:hypothetical protein